MKILDRYILKHVTLPILFCVYTLMLLFVIGDVFDRLDGFLKNEIPVMTILRYYSLMMPFIFSHIIPWAVFLGTVYLLSIFTRHHELIAMKAAGLEIFSIVKPLIYLGFCISVFTFIINDRVVPPTYRLAEEIRKTQIEKQVSEEQEMRNVTLIKGGKQFFVKYLNPKTYDIQDIRIHFLNKKFKIEKKIAAKSGIWDGENWVFSVVQIFKLGNDRKIIGEPVFLPKYVFQDTTIMPEELVEAGRTLPMKTMGETRATIKVLKENGLDFSAELTELHDRFASSWMSLIIILILLPILAKSHVRTGLVLKILLCLGLIAVYHLIHAITVAMGSSGALPPLLCAWSSHLIFGVTSLFMLRRANF